jgi:hypothetical protein
VELNQFERKRRGGARPGAGRPPKREPERIFDYSGKFNRALAEELGPEEFERQRRREMAESTDALTEVFIEALEQLMASNAVRFLSQRSRDAVARRETLRRARYPEKVG